MSSRQAPLPRREASFSSATSSRASSRASTPPSSSTPGRSFLASTTAAIPRTNLPWSTLLTSTGTPSVATFLHYTSLLLSLRLVVVNPRWTTFLLCLCLATTLEGRAKAERLGLRNTMRGVMAVVGAGVAWSNMATMRSDDLAAVHVGGESGPCAWSQQPLLQVSRSGEGEGRASNVTVAVCDDNGELQRPDLGREDLADRLVDMAAVWIAGEESCASTADKLCEVVAAAVPSHDSMSIAIAARPRAAKWGIKAIDVTVRC